MSKVQNSLSLLFFWVFLGAANFVFNKLFLYLYFPWLDVFMHTFGGMLIIWSWYHFYTSGKFQTIIRKPLLHPLIFLSVLIVVWEVYRYLMKTVVVENYVLDTTVDLLVGFTGGVVAYLWFSSRIDKNFKE